MYEDARKYNPSGQFQDMFIFKFSLTRVIFAQVLLCHFR